MLRQIPRRQAISSPVFRALRNSNMRQKSSSDSLLQQRLGREQRTASASCSQNMAAFPFFAVRGLTPYPAALCRRFILHSPHHFFSTKNRRLAFLWLFTPSLTRFAVVCQLKLYRFGESEQPTGTVHLRSRSERQRNSYKLCSIKFISTRRANNEAHPGGQTCKHCVCLFSLLA